MPADRTKRFESVKLYVLVTSTMCKGSVREVVRAAIAGGADAIQLRETTVPDAECLALAAELRELTDETDKLLIINNRPDIASIVGADGLHVIDHRGAVLGAGGHGIIEVIDLGVADAVW